MGHTEQWALLAPERHQGLSWRRFRDYRFARSQRWVEIAAEELQPTALALPLACVRQAGRWQLVAVLGDPDDACHCASATGRWRTRYVPALLRARPFALAADGRLQIDEASDLLQQGQAGEPLFSGAGAPTPAVRQVARFLTRIQRGCERSRRAVAALAAENLLVPITFRKARLHELYRVDERRLQQLPDSGMAALRRLEALPLAYAQLLSLGNLPLLDHWRRAPLDPADGEQLVPVQPLVEQEIEYEWVASGDAG